MRIPVIDYDAHPAYAAFAGRADDKRAAALRTIHADLWQDLDSKFDKRIDRPAAAEDASDVARKLAELE